MTAKKRHPAKGEHGYFSWEKRKRAAIVALMYGIVLLIFFTGLYRYHTRKNILTVVAILGVLPAAKWTVNLIMVLLQGKVSQRAYDGTEQAARLAQEGEDLTRGYELCVTAEEGRLTLDALVVVGNFLVAYASSSKGQFAFMEKHLSKMLSSGGIYGTSVKIFLDLDRYLDRVSALASHPEAYRRDLRHAADAVHEGETREQAILRLVKNMAI